MAKIKSKKFNRVCCIDRKDPSERIGNYLPCFSLYQTYSNIKDIEKIKEELYNSLIENIENKTPDYIKSSLINFADAKHQRIEGSRKYIIVERETPRKTQIKTLIRILSQKDTLYLGIDSYILGQFSLLKFVKRIWFTLATSITLAIIATPILFVFLSILLEIEIFPVYIRRIFYVYISNMRDLQAGTEHFFLLVVIIFLFLWRDVIKGMVHHLRICLPLRQCFNKLEDDESFNTDDIFLFFKSILPIVIFTIKDCFKKHDIDYKTLDEFMNNITNINNMQTINNYASNQGNQGQGSFNKR